MEIYQIIFQDEYNNLFELGYYTDLEKAIEEINESYLSLYNVKLKADDLKLYPSTFGYCLDLCLGDVFGENDELYDCYIRGFVKDLDEEIKILTELKGEHDGKQKND